MRRAVNAAVTGLTGLALAFATGEAAVRLARPTPRAQIVRDGVNVALQERHGQPVWWSPESERFWDLTCPEAHPDAPRVMLLGDSIFRGVIVPEEQNFSSLLRGRIEAALGGEACVMNVSEPGWSFQQEWAVAQDLVPKLRPDVLILEMWTNLPESYTRVGGAAYRFGPVVRGSGDRPHLFEGAVDDWLFTRSRLWEYATLALAPGQRVADVDELWGAFLFDQVTPLIELAGGADVLMVAAPPLHQTFSATLAERQAALTHDGEVGMVGSLGRAYATAEAWARLHRVGWLDLASALEQEPVELVRLDTCCHFNARGHEAIERAVEPWVVERLRARGGGAP
ncbi:MAG TPA: SGNH/GDSL hydrolase family protein [Myxococcota bacterium]|nr:SGNH/GDSL hydrolase family protein [Myxococcota bacterium]